MIELYIFRYYFYQEKQDVKIFHPQCYHTMQEEDCNPYEPSVF